MDIAIVGAGVAGLAAGFELERAGHQVQILEASDGPGGRIRTDAVDGHLLDRGFQILLSAYPEATAVLDYDQLDLRSFAPGAMVRVDDRFHRIGDPLREPASLLSTARAPIGSIADKARILAFRRAVARGDLAALWSRPETTANERLAQAGFSPKMIERFLGPLFTGITLDPSLSGSSRVLEFVFRMLGAGDAVVPAQGMGAIGTHLAGRLTNGTVRYNSAVSAVASTSVTLDGGETIAADQVVVATGRSEAASLTGMNDAGWRGVTSLWLRAAETPIDGPLLVLNGTGRGAINSMAVMSEVSSAYAPPGSSTIVVSSPGIGNDLVDALQNQLRQWFGPVTDTWDVLRVDRIEQAQPILAVGHNRSLTTRTDDGVWVCGDHLADSSINGAIGSGRAVAKAVLALGNGANAA